MYYYLSRCIKVKCYIIFNILIISNFIAIIRISYFIFYIYMSYTITLTTNKLIKQDIITNINKIMLNLNQLQR
jgi:hypothetical protein